MPQKLVGLAVTSALLLLVLPRCTSSSSPGGQDVDAGAGDEAGVTPSDGAAPEDAAMPGDGGGGGACDGGAAVTADVLAITKDFVGDWKQTNGQGCTTYAGFTVYPTQGAPPTDADIAAAPAWSRPARRCLTKRASPPALRRAASRRVSTAGSSSIRIRTGMSTRAGCSTSTRTARRWARASAR